MKTSTTSTPLISSSSHSICEQEDIQRRERETRIYRLIPARICPTAQAYKDRRVEMRAVNDDARSGLYQRCMLHDCLSTILPHDQLTIPLKSWCSAPMASLRRTFQIYRDSLSDVIPVYQLELLRKLQYLHTRPAPSCWEDDFEEGKTGVDVTHEEVETSIARDMNSPGTANVYIVASGISIPARTRRKGSSGGSTRTRTVEEESGPITKRAVDRATGVSAFAKHQVALHLNASAFSKTTSELIG